MRIKLDRTLCDGFGACARHAPEFFSLDDWGYAALVGTGEIAAEDQNAVTRALLDCPVHAIIEMGEHRPPGDGAAHHGAQETPEPEPKTEDNEAISGFVR